MNRWTELMTIIILKGHLTKLYEKNDTDTVLTQQWWYEQWGDTNTGSPCLCLGAGVFSSVIFVRGDQLGVAVALHTWHVTRSRMCSRKFKKYFIEFQKYFVEVPKNILLNFKIILLHITIAIVHPLTYSHILEQVLATTCQWHDAVLTISWPEVWCVAVCWHLHCPELHPERNWAEPPARQSPVCQGSGPGTLTTTAPARPGHGTGDWE